MKKIPYTNDSKRIKHVGNVTLLPGQTREVYESDLDLPAHSIETHSDKREMDIDISTVISLPVSKLKDALVNLSVEELAAIETAENSKQSPRAGALSLIAAERVKRASQSFDGDKSADEFALMVSGMSDTELADQDYPEDSAFSVIINDEKNKRALIAFKSDFSAFDSADLEGLKADYEDQPEYIKVIEELLAEKAES